MRRWNLFQKLAFLAGMGVTLHLLVLLVVGADADTGWFTYAPSDFETLRSAPMQDDTGFGDTLIRIAGVSLWTAGAIWLLAEPGDRDDD